MIEEAHAAIGFAALRLGNFEPLANGGFAHGLMRAQRDEDVEGFGHLGDLSEQRLKQQSDRRGPRAVRNNQQNLFVPVLFRRAGLADQIGYLLAS